MKTIITLKKAILSAAVVALGLVFAVPTQAQLIPEGPGGGGTAPAPAPQPAPAANIQCKITELKQEHNVTLDGQKGVKFHFKIEIDNAKGQKVRPTVFFMNKNEKILKAVDAKYGNAAGEMMATNEFSPMYDQTDYTGWVFMPYNAMYAPETPDGKYNIKVLASVYHVEGNKFVSAPVKDSFDLNLGPATPAPVKNDNGLIK